MAIAEKLEYLNGTKQAIKTAIQNRGVSVSDTDTFREYATKIGDIGETVDKTKFGANIDMWVGDVDANGVLQAPTWSGALNFSGVKRLADLALVNAFSYRENLTSVDLSSLQTVGKNSLSKAFYNCTNLTSVDLSSLQSVDYYSLANVCYGCAKLTSVNLSSLQTVGSNGFYSAFSNCYALTSVDLSSLQSVDNNGLSGTFSSCNTLTSVDLSSLQSVGSSGLSNAFLGCTNLVTMSFPSLTGFGAAPFGSQTYSYSFRNCTALTEIHFRADVQATIEAMTGYADKWGATNATIYFDL